MKERIVGVTIDTKSPHTKKKVYYYKTNEKFDRGDQLRIGVPSGGKPNATIVVENSKKKFSRKIKNLEVKK